MESELIVSEDGFRMPAEFEPHHGCVMIWPKRPGSWPYGAKAAKHVFAQIAVKISQSEKVYLLADPDLVEEAVLYIEDIMGEVSLQKASDMITGENVGNSASDDRESDFCEKMPKSFDNKRKLDGREESCKEYVSESEQYCDSEQYFNSEQHCNSEQCSNIEILPIESDDAWARDVAPTFVTNGKGEIHGISWQFNAWGGDYDGLYAHWEKDDALAAKLCTSLGIVCCDAAPFVLEGGSIHSDGEGTILATEACLLSLGRNPSLSKEEIEQKLKKYLGAQKILWLPHGIYGDETNEHIDNVCAFVRPGEVVLAWTDDESDPQYAYSKSCLEQLAEQKDAKGRKIKVHKLYIPQKPVCITKDDLPGYQYEEGEAERTEGERLAASYVNFYISNGSVLVPQFGDVQDEPAVKLLAELFPEREIVPVYARDILLGGGNIHCITQQIPKYGVNDLCRKQ